MILLIEYFVPQSEERHQEYLTCIEENLKNNHIDYIEIFISDDSELPIKSDKIKINNLVQRPTYGDFFQFANKKYPDSICILSNADIIFDDSLRYITKENMQKRFLALTRWDIKEDGSHQIFRPGPGDSQDSWIFKTPINIEADFTLGRLGCDNRITYLAHQAGYKVSNPAHQIIIKHLHKTEYRTTSKQIKNTVIGWHLLVQPCATIDAASRTQTRFWKV